MKQNWVVRLWVVNYIKRPFLKKLKIYFQRILIPKVIQELIASDYTRKTKCLLKRFNPLILTFL